MCFQRSLFLILTFPLSSKKHLKTNILVKLCFNLHFFVVNFVEALDNTNKSNSSEERRRQKNEVKKEKTYENKSRSFVFYNSLPVKLSPALCRKSMLGFRSCGASTILSSDSPMGIPYTQTGVFHQSASLNIDTPRSPYFTI